MQSQRLDFLALGVALSISVSIIFAICSLAAYVIPELHFATQFVGLFTDAAPGTHRSLVEGMTVSICISWIFTSVLAVTYNCLERKQYTLSPAHKDASRRK